MMVIFCKIRTHSARDIDKKRKQSTIKFIIKIKEDILMWKKLLALIMSLCMVAGMRITAFASETDQSSGGGFYVMTEEVPQQAIEHVRNNIGAFLLSNK